MRHIDTRQPIDTFEGPGAKDAAERAVSELRDFAQRYNCDLVARVVKEDHVKYGGQWRTRAVWGVFLVPPEGEERPGEGTAQSAPARRPGRHVTSS